MPTLVFEIEDGSQIVAPLEGRTTIGRAEGNDVVAERDDVSPEHAEIFQAADNTWWVRDRSSAAGTFVNGVRASTHRLVRGDLLRFGSVSARFFTPADVVALDAVAMPGPAPAVIDPEIERKKLELSRIGEALTQARAEFEKTVKEHESRLAVLRAESARLEPVVGDKRKELSGLDAELARAMAGLEKTTREEQERIAALRSEAAELEPAVEGRRQEISKLDSGLAHARTTYEKGVKEQEERLGKLREAAASLESSVNERRRELSALEARRARATTDFEKTRAEQEKHLEAARAEAAGLQAAVGSRKQELSVLGSALANAQVEMDRAAKSHEARVEALEQNAAELTSRIKEKNGEITGLTAALQEARKIIDESRGLEAGLQENRRKHEDLARSVAAAAGRHEVLSHQARTLAEQQRAKLVEMDRLKRDVVDIEARKSAVARELEEREAGRLQVEESLKDTARQHEQATIELARVDGEKKRLADDVRRLGEQCGSLGLEISVLETRKSELRGVVDGLDKRHFEAVGKLDEVQDKLKSAALQHQQLLADIAESTARQAKLRIEAGEVAAQVEAARGEVESQTATHGKLSSLNENLQAEIGAVESRLVELKGTEDQLVAAREELRGAEAAHLALKGSIEELGRTRDANAGVARELENYVSGLEGSKVRLEQEIPQLESQKERTECELAAVTTELEDLRRVLTGEIGQLRATAAGEKARLDELLQAVAGAERFQTELAQQGREFETVARQLDEVRSQLRSVEIDKDKVESQAQVLRQACSATQLRLSELEGAEKSTELRVSRLASQEKDLQQSVKLLGDEQDRERVRAEELRRLAAEAELAGTQEKERSMATMVELRAEIARLESRLAHARTWSAELDQLYEKLGKMPDASPEAREAWLEIQRRKNDIAEQLPTGIQVRPQSRPTVVPRGR